MRLEDRLTDLSILAVDDQNANLLVLQAVLRRAGYTRVQITTDVSRVPSLFLDARPDLVVLDLHMPGMDGFELMERLAPAAGGRAGVPFLVLTADITEAVRRRALECGARDFLTKPFSETELLLRVRNLLEVQRLHGRLREQNATLERQVAARTRDLEQARLEVLSRLALAAEYRDDATQEHAWRIGRTCGLLADAIGVPDSEVDVIRRAATLHDIGKIGIPDAILLKPGKLTDEEFAVMKTHTTIGAEILSGGRTAVLRLAEQIALSHHERWGGGGYPRRLRGDVIPLAARIVAVADVFDALTHERPYKKAWSVENAVGEIISQRGRQFDPTLVDAFATLEHVLLVSPLPERGYPVEGPRPRAEAPPVGVYLAEAVTS